MPAVEPTGSIPLLVLPTLKSTTFRWLEVKDNTTYRISANLRDVDGIMIESGFEQFNARANFSSTAFNEKLKYRFYTVLYEKRSK